MGVSYPQIIPEEEAMPLSQYFFQACVCFSILLFFLPGIRPNHCLNRHDTTTNHHGHAADHELSRVPVRWPR